LGAEKFGSHANPTPLDFLIDMTMRLQGARFKSGQNQCFHKHEEKLVDCTLTMKSETTYVDTELGTKADYFHAATPLTWAFGNTKPSPTKLSLDATDIPSKTYADTHLALKEDET
jgi:hypothetical protein